MQYVMCKILISGLDWIVTQACSEQRALTARDAALRSSQSSLVPIILSSETEL